MSLILNFLLLIFILFPSISFAQGNQDSTLTLEEFLFLVKNYHPVAKQSNLVPQSAKQQLRIARGSMDPIIGATYDNKTFDTKNYWSLLEAKVRVPVWYGIDITGGYQYFTGDYLDPSETTPSIGLPSAGLNVSLGKGLWMNERMAAIKQAKIFLKSSEYERQLIINDLYFNAINDYWNWALSKKALDINKNAVEVAITRLNGIRLSFKYGEKPAVDTLEANILLQSRIAMYQQSELNYIKSGLKLSTHLWNDNIEPLELAEYITPQNLDNNIYSLEFGKDSLAKLLGTIESINPQLKMLQFKIDMLKVDRRLKVNKLLPTIDVSYNFLYNDNNLIFLRDNYKLGVNFKFPLYLRQERGELRMAKLKIMDSELKLDQKKLEVRNKLISNYEEFRIMTDQVLIYTNMVTNYRKLLLAEINKFQIGESSVFMVNSREVKLIEAEIKLAEIRTKYLKSYSGIYWSAGILGLE